jgi:hypothetical protein
MLGFCEVYWFLWWCFEGSGLGLRLKTPLYGWWDMANIYSIRRKHFNFRGFTEVSKNLFHKNSAFKSSGNSFYIVQ